MEQLFRCSYCYTSGTKKEIEKHEEMCVFNPENRFCGSCLCWDAGFCNYIDRKASSKGRCMKWRSTK